MDGYEEITKMLTSLVQDNETLKHDNAELQQLLNDSREDFATLQGDFEEYKANPPVFRSGGKSQDSFVLVLRLSPFISQHSTLETFPPSERYFDRIQRLPRTCVALDYIL